MKTKFNNIRKKQSLYEEVANLVKDSILSGIYREGEALPNEVELSTQLGVSRSVVREATRSLQSRGFVEIRRGAKGGIYVRELNQSTICENLSDLIFARKIAMNDLAAARNYLEPEVSRLAALNCTEGDLDALEDSILAYEQTKDKEKIITLNTLFHKRVGRACGNLFYATLMDVIMSFTEEFVRTIKPLSHIIHRQGEHREILTALREHDSDKAMEVTLKHISHINDTLLELERKYLRLKAGAIR